MSNVILPNLAPECGDAERRSLLKINALLADYLYGPGGGTGGGPPVSTLLDVVKALKCCDAIRTTSGAFVNTFTVYTGPCVLWQVDCFSIAPTDRWVFIIDFESYLPSQFPVYIAKIYPYHSTSFQVTAPFNRGVTVALSTAPNFPCSCDPDPNMLVTGTVRIC